MGNRRICLVTATRSTRGAVINAKNRGKGALIDAVSGGLTGAGVGYYMDNGSA